LRNTSMCMGVNTPVLPPATREVATLISISCTSFSPCSARGAGTGGGGRGGVLGNPGGTPVGLIACAVVGSVPPMHHAGQARPS
jgi:hypothetical protein